MVVANDDIDAWGRCCRVGSRDHRVIHLSPRANGNWVLTYAILCVVKQGKTSLKFERVGTTVSQLTLTNVLPGTEAMKTHGITPEILRETGVRLDGAIEKSQEQHRIGKGQGSNACLF